MGCFIIYHPKIIPPVSSMSHSPDDVVDDFVVKQHSPSGEKTLNGDHNPVIVITHYLDYIVSVCGKIRISFPFKS